MDAELRFLSALLHANVSEQAEYWNKQVPLQLFALREKEVHWVHKFREQHGKFPTAALFTQKFKVGLPMVSDPIAATLEPVQTQAAYVQIKAAIDKTSKLFDENADANTIITNFRANAEKVTTFVSEYDDENLSNAEIALRRYSQMQKALQTKGNLIIDSPWAPLNKIIKFIRPGELVILTARLGLGKTWVLLDWLNYLAKKNVSTFLLSKEMPTPQISDRLTAVRFGLDWERFRGLDLDIWQQVQWKIKAKTAGPYPLLVSGEETFHGTGVEQLYAKVQRVKPAVVAVDGAYLLQVAGLGKGANDVQRLTMISNSLKRLAKVCKVPVIAVIQMNRSAENKQGVAKGGVTTVYGADAWGQDADFLLEVAGERGTYERVVRVLKGRDTAIGDFFINFQLSPKPDFSPKVSLSANSKLGVTSLRIIK